MTTQMTTIETLVRKTRSVRRFHQDYAVDPETLKKLVDLGRMSASGANLQPLKYIISSSPEKNAEVFSCLAWARYIKGWKGPEEGERPAAYIIVLGDTGILEDTDEPEEVAAEFYPETTAAHQGAKAEQESKITSRADAVLGDVEDVEPEEVEEAEEKPEDKPEPEEKKTVIGQKPEAGKETSLFS